RRFPDMVQVQQRVLKKRPLTPRRKDAKSKPDFLAAWRLCVGLVLAALLAEGASFYPDDPLWRDPPPRPVKPPRTRGINEYYDFFRNTFFQPGKEAVKAGRVPR